MNGRILLSVLGVCAVLLHGCMMNTTNPPQNDNQNLARSCDANDSRVGQTAQLSTLRHNVSGTAVIVDDCTIEIRNFTYDGGGPNVVVYADVDRNFNTPLILSEDISGTVFNGETLTVQSPESASLDDVRAISIWCLQFDVNFGDGLFQ